MGVWQLKSKKKKKKKKVLYSYVIMLIRLSRLFLRLTDLVYADDMCLLASNPQHLQALIDASVGYCATLHMEISVAKTKVMVVSRSLARSPGLGAAVFTCNGLVVEQVDTFKHLGLHFHSSGGIYPTLSHL